MNSPCVLLVAAEASGDLLGGDLIAALRSRLGPSARFIGVGGRRMAGQGMVSAFDIDALGVVGIFDALKAYPTVLRLAAKVGDLASREKPDIAVLIDSWGFNIRVAARIRRASPGTKLIKYVAPQVWATRPGRARTLARAVDRLLTIHSFDAEFFTREGLPVTFVGNPALQREPESFNPGLVREAIGASRDEPILLLLPGSRRGEVDRLMPRFKDAVARLRTDWPSLKAIAAPAETVADRVAAHLAGWASPTPMFTDDAHRSSAMQAATVAIACSGTVTTELAMAKTAMVVTYRLGPATAMIARRLIRTRFITLINVAAGRFVVPELVQEACTGEALASEASRLLRDDELRRRQVTEQSQALDKMRGGVNDPVGAAADAIVDCLFEASGHIGPRGQPINLV